MKLLSGLIGLGLGVACIVLSMEYFNAREASTCLGKKVCAQTIARGAGKDTGRTKMAAIACGIGGVFFIWQATRNE